MPGTIDPIAARKQHSLLMASLMLLICGTGLVLVTTNAVPAREGLLYTLLVVAGAVINLFAFWRGRRNAMIFWGFLFLLSGSFLLAFKAAAPAVGLERLWPFLMILIGVSISASGFFKARRAKASFLIPAACFVLLGCLFMLFSLKLVEMSFASFIRKLWPIFFIAAGCIVFGLYVGNRIRFARTPDKEG